MAEYIVASPIDYGTNAGIFRFEEGQVVDEETFGEGLEGLIQVGALRERTEEEDETEESAEEADPEAKNLSGLPEQAAEKAPRVEKPEHI